MAARRKASAQNTADQNVTPSLFERMMQVRRGRVKFSLERQRHSAN